MNLYLKRVYVKDDALMGDLCDEKNAIVGTMTIGEPGLCAVLHKHGPHVAFTVAVVDDKLPALSAKQDAVPEPQPTPHPAMEPAIPPPSEKKVKKGK